MKADFSTRRRVARPRPLDVLLLTLSGAALIWSAVAAAAAWREVEGARLALAQLRERAPAQERRLHELEGSRHGRNDALVNQALHTLTSPPQLILADIETTLPSGARLEALTLTYGHEAVELEMQVVARTPQIYDTFVAGMEGSGRFGHLTFGSEDRSGEMKVTLRADYITRGDS